MSDETRYCGNCRQPLVGGIWLGFEGPFCDFLCVKNYILAEAGFEVIRVDRSCYSC